MACVLLFACQPGSRLARARQRRGLCRQPDAHAQQRGLLARWRPWSKPIQRERVDVVNTHSGRDSLLAGLAGRLAWRQPLVVHPPSGSCRSPRALPIRCCRTSVVAVSEYACANT